MVKDAEVLAKQAVKHLNIVLAIEAWRIEFRGER